MQRRQINFLDIQMLLNEAKENDIEKPQISQEMGERFPTLNNMGCMVNFIDELTEEFIRFSKDLNSLEIGTAFGYATIEALKNGSKSYIANDADIKHLKILAKTLQDYNPNLLNYIKFIDGYYPQDVYLKSNSIDNLLISRVLHFMSPEQIYQTVDDLYRILTPGGRIFVICNTPYNQSYKNFIPVFEKALANKEPHPGFTPERKHYVNKDLYDESTIEQLYSGQFYYFTHDSFYEFFPQDKFNIEKIMYVPYKGILSLDGKETIGALISKIRG